jgi:hypothetical protein
MSVAPLSAQEFGCFVAIAHKHLKAGPIPQLCQLASMASSGNAGAYSAQYGDPMEPATAEEIEAAALDYLADRLDMVTSHFGPLAYNMVANDGRAYVAPGYENRENYSMGGGNYLGTSRYGGWKVSSRSGLHQERYEYFGK